jgi:hypothetical protein
MAGLKRQMSAAGHHVVSFFVRAIEISVLVFIVSRTVRVEATEANGFEGIADACPTRISVAACLTF